MKQIIIICWIVLLSLLAPAQTKTCTAGCAPTTVLLFDFEVKVSAENTHPELFKKLYYIAPVLRKEVQSASSCLNFLDVNEMKRPEDIFQGTVPDISTAPQGGINLAEYLLTGSLDGEGSVFMVTANIETAVSRKKIKTVHVPFSFTEGDTYISVAGKIAAALGPLQGVIRDYETKERETNRKVAFGEPVSHQNETPELLTVIPKKHKLSMGEETEVEITLKDCDGYPLKNRVVSFTGERYDSVWQKGSYGGTVTPSKVITDAGGKAKVKFKAAPAYSFAAILAHYSCEEPCGRKIVIAGSAAIDMQCKPYKVIVRYSKRIREDTDRKSSTSEYTERSEGLHNYLVQYHAEFYYAPKHPLEKLAIASNDDPADCSIFIATENGRSSDLSFLHYIRRSTEGEIIADYQNVNNLQGKITEEDPAAVFLDTSGFHSFGLILNLNVTGTFNGNRVEPDMLNAVTLSASSINNSGEVLYYSHLLNFPDIPYRQDCTFVYEARANKNENGVMTKSEEFLKIKVLVEK